MNPFDRPVLLWLNGHVGRWVMVDDLARIVASDYLVLLLGVLTLVGLWFAGRDPEERERFQIHFFTGAAAIGLANLAVVIVNVIWKRPRPFVAMPDRVHLLFYPSTDPSFPSNPSAVAFAAATSVALVSPRLGALLALFGLAQGVARVYTGVFYPTDVVGGAAIGVAIVVVPLGLWRFFDPIPQIVIRVARAFMLA